MIGRHSGFFSGQKLSPDVRAKLALIQAEHLTARERTEELARLEKKILEQTEVLHQLRRKHDKLQRCRNSA